MVFPEPGGRMMRFQFLKEKSLAVMVVVGLWWEMFVIVSLRLCAFA